MKKKKTYADIRRKQLLEDNEKEDKYIKMLEKKLRMDRVKGKNKNKRPSWITEGGFDYLLDFDKDLKELDAQSNQAIIGEKLKSKKNSNIYGQAKRQKIESSENDSDSELEESKELSENESAEDDSEEEEVEDIEPLETASKKNVNKKIADVNKNAINCQKNILKESEIIDSSNNEKLSITRDCRRILNRVSETQMMQVVHDINQLFFDKPRAVVRSILIDEIDHLLNTSPIGSRVQVGWLQQELAVCLACVHCLLQSGGQQTNLIAHVVEKLVSQMGHDDGDEVGMEEIANSKTGLVSRFVFLAFLFRFGVLAGDLIIDIVEEFSTKASSLVKLQTAHFISIAVGPQLRKENLQRCQAIVQATRTHIVELADSDVEMLSELEGLCERLSEKHSKNPCQVRSEHLKKQMKVWTKGLSTSSSELRLRLRLADLRQVGSRGRWWLVGSAVPPPDSAGSATMLPANQEAAPSLGNVDNSQSIKVKQTHQQQLSAEAEAAANRLGLRTPARRSIFNVLTSTPGGPDATASALMRACTMGWGGPSRAGGVSKSEVSGALSSREREAVQVVVHVLLAETPFNRFYARVLGGLLASNRRFHMMVKCALWDVMGRDELPVEAKENAGRSTAILAVVFDLSLALLRRYEFGDSSSGNVAFLRSLVCELCNHDFNLVSRLFARLASTLPRLGRNLRVFMRRHIVKARQLGEDRDKGKSGGEGVGGGVDQGNEDGHRERQRVFVAKLVESMRDLETF